MTLDAAFNVKNKCLFALLTTTSLRDWGHELVRAMFLALVHNLRLQQYPLSSGQKSPFF